MTRAWIIGALALASVSVAHADGSGSASGSGSGSAAPAVVQLPADLLAPEVHASASPSEVRLGDPFTVFVTATYSTGVEVNLREPVDLGGAFEVRRRVSEDRARGDGKHVREWQLEVLPWETGELQLPPIAVTFTVGGRAGQVASEAVPMRVFGVLADPDDPKAMRGAVPPTVLLHRDWFWLYVGGGAAGAIVLAVIAAWTVRHRRRYAVALTGGTRAPRRFDPPTKGALERLLAIEASGVLDRDRERKGGYAELVEVLRDYVRERYRIATRDRTTRELLLVLAPVAPLDERDRIGAWLARCDLVKYANVRATADDAHAAIAEARAFVLATMPRDRAERGERPTADARAEAA